MKKFYKLLEIKMYLEHRNINRSLGNKTGKQQIKKIVHK